MKKTTKTTEWNVISALAEIVETAQFSALTPKFWKSVDEPIKYLVEKLGLTPKQVLIIAILTDIGGCVTWKDIADFLNIRRINVMTLTDEIDDLIINKRWVVNAVSVNSYRGFRLANGVINALRHNEVFTPKPIENLTNSEFLSTISSYIEDNDIDNLATQDNHIKYLKSIVKKNTQLPICAEIENLEGLQFLVIIHALAQYYFYGVDNCHINSAKFSNTATFTFRREMSSGESKLFTSDLIEFYCEDGMIDTDFYRISDRVRDVLLADFTPEMDRNDCKQDKSLIPPESITDKKLFYNPEEKMQIEKLASHISQDKYSIICKRLDEKKMRKGFTCLFYGTPGTGKTETALQLAKATGRSIMQVDISEIRDKWVGQSEKNIKAIFRRYANNLKSMEVTPILFFNEADAIFNNRSTHADSSADKMNNTIQNIILQEMENFEGILIATTNLTTMLDPAFERRFLYKVEFKDPQTDVKAKIWKSLIESLSDKDAHYLAEKYKFSGGQIENIARKYNMEYILNGVVPTIDVIDSFCAAEIISKAKYRTTGFAV